MSNLKSGTEQSSPNSRSLMKRSAKAGLIAALLIAACAGFSPSATADDHVLLKEKRIEAALRACKTKECRVKVRRLALLDAYEDVSNANAKLERDIMRAGRAYCEGTTMAMDHLTLRIAKAGVVGKRLRKAKREAKDLRFKMARQVGWARRQYRLRKLSRGELRKFEKAYKDAKRYVRVVSVRQKAAEEFLKKSFGLGSRTRKIRCGVFK